MLACAVAAVLLLVTLGLAARAPTHRDAGAGSAAVGSAKVCGDVRRGPGRSTAKASAPPASSGTTATFTAGIVAGSALGLELPCIQALGARSARTEFDINTPVKETAAAIEPYARAGVQPLLLAGFPVPTPTLAEARKLAAWAAAFGPGGTYVKQKGLPDRVAVLHIEFGNETSYSFQYAETARDPSWATSSFYRGVAEAYGRAVKAASTDRGRCLSDNYGWNRCLTYPQATATLTATLRGLRAT